MIRLLLAFVVACQAPPAFGADWVKLVFELQADQRLDKVDRRFVDWMANHLTATDDPVEVTAKQQRWLLDIKRRALNRQKMDKWKEGQ